MITSELFWYVPLTAFSGSFIVQLKLRPPSTINVCPVTKSPPVINPRIAPATSSALAIRCSGKPAEALAITWGYSAPKCSLIHGVSVNAGATQFTRTRGASAAKRSFDVHVENLIPYFISHPIEIGEINPMRYACIIDQYVQASELP